MMNYQLNRPYIFTFASGKGGVGKSLATVNVAESLNAQGFRTAIIDADLGFSSCSTLLNEYTQGTITDVVKGHCNVDDVIHTTQSGLTLIIGADEPNETGKTWSKHLDMLDKAILRLHHNHDFILIDTPAGASDTNLWALDRSDLCALLLIDEPTVISDVYRFCKFVLQIDPDFPFAGIINMCENKMEANYILTRFNRILGHFMNRELPYLGHIPYAEAIRDSISQQQPLSALHPVATQENQFQYIASALSAFANKQPRAKLA